LTAEETDEVWKRLVAKYGLQVPKEIGSSVFSGQPKLPVLLSRASFRPEVDVRTTQRSQFQRQRRNLLRGVFGLAVISLSALALLDISSGSSSQPSPPPQTLTNVPSNPTSPTNPTGPTSQISQIIANSANLPPDQSMTYNDPSLGPVLLIHLDNGQFVAYSSICTHAGCQVQFDPSAKDIVCPCHGAVFDPYNNARVLGGPAPYPLQKIPIRYDSGTGNIYSAG